MSAQSSMVNPQTLLFATLLGCIGSYFVVNRLLDDVDTDGNSAAVAGMRVFVTTTWSLWLLIAIYVGVRKDLSVWYLHLALLCQLVIILFHGILKSLD